MAHQQPAPAEFFFLTGLGSCIASSPSSLDGVKRPPANPTQAGEKPPEGVPWISHFPVCPDDS